MLDVLQKEKAAAEKKGDTLEKIPKPNLKENSRWWSEESWEEDIQGSLHDGRHGRDLRFFR